MLASAALALAGTAAVRRGLSKPPTVELEARLRGEPEPVLELRFSHDSRATLDVERLDVPRDVAAAIGLRAPSGFRDVGDSETASYVGHHSVVRGAVSALALPVEGAAGASGTVSAVLSYRSGFGSRTTVASAELRSG